MVNMKRITSGITKLIRHKEICEGNLSVISAQVVLTDKCNLNCSFCTAGGKERSSNSVLSLHDVLGIVDDLKYLGCKGIEYTGGGEPTLHKDFTSIVDLTYDKGIDIGLVTNGTTINILSNAIWWSKFDWVRVSINSSKENYVKVHGYDKFDAVMSGLSVLSKDIPGKFGVSYIYSDQPENDIDSLLKSIEEYAPNVGYVRVGADVLKYKNGLPKGINGFNEKVLEFSKKTGIFVDIQTERDLSKPSKCYMGRLKPSINADGFVYPCCVAQHRVVNKLCDIYEYKELVSNDLLKEVDVNKCPYCIYREINDFISDVVGVEVKNINFI
jgi:MoaA/NifB/PqqE/SkfB family radical SAM enzyme